MALQQKADMQLNTTTEAEVLDDAKDPAAKRAG
jgi:hypothetical protein